MLSRKAISLLYSQFRRISTVAMKEAIVSPGPVVNIQDSPIPKPGDEDALIKVVVSGSNPKDWKVPEWMNFTHNSGDDIAGTIVSLGSKAQGSGLKEGQRVAAFHRMRTEHGSFAEYAIAPVWTTFAIPDSVSYEEAATIPLAALTAVVGLFDRLGFPEPSDDGRSTKSTGPLLVYGGATAVGAFVIKIAKRAGIGPLVVVAGRGTDFVKSLIDEAAGDKIVDYRQDNDKLVQDLKSALAGQKLMYAYDAVSEHGSYNIIYKVLDPNGGKVTFVLPLGEDDNPPSTVHASRTMVGDVHGDLRNVGDRWSKVIAKGLADGWFKGHPVTVVPGGLEGVQQALTNLKQGKASAEKYVFKIADTPGAGKD